MAPMAPVSRQAARTLAVILLVGAALRIGACVVVAPTPLMNDEVLYHKLPARVAAGDELGDAAGRTPGVLVFYAGLYRAFGDRVSVARGGNVLLSAVTLGLIFLVARRLAGERAGLVAAALAAAYPVFIAFSHYLLSETLYVFLLLAALATLLSGGSRPTAVRAGAAGLLFGTCALTREANTERPGNCW